MGYLFRSMRVRQWYKNLLVFLPLFFAGRVFELDSIVLTLFGFVALGLVSSSGYIVNDLIDRKQDAKHPEKKDRPIASGKVRPWQALLLLSVLLLAGLGLAAALSFPFFALAGALYLLMLLYAFWGRNELFVDILLISVNYIVRAVSGAYIASDSMKPYIPISPWLMLCPFFLALFLASAKRRGDFLLLDGSSHHRDVLRHYTQSMTQALMTISTTLLILSYGLYTFLSGHFLLIFTLPFALYTVFRYYVLVESGSDIGRHAEKAYQDLRLVLSALLWVVITAGIIYL